MIFIILAIIILIVSFILALASLIREQKTISSDYQEIDLEESEDTHGQKQVETTVLTPGPKPSDTEDRKMVTESIVSQLSRESPSASAEPFPWEDQPIQKTGADSREFGYDKDTEELWRNKQVNQTDRKEGLSGEISIKEISQKDRD